MSEKLFIFLSILILFNCSGSVKYLEPNVNSFTSTRGISEHDIQKMCNDILEQIYSSDLIVSNSIPVIAMLKISNETSEYINTDDLVEKNIIIPLKENNKIRVAERKNLNKIIEEKVLGQAGLTDNEGSIADSSLIGVEYYVRGKLGSLEKSSFSKEYIWYSLSLQLISTANGEVKWTFNSELRKLRKKGFFHE